MSRVLLVNMPFSSLRWPALGISLLQAALKREGIDCDLAYLNFDLAEIVGREAYEWINDSLGFVLGGERLFAKTLFGSSLSGDLEYATDRRLPQIVERVKGEDDSIDEPEIRRKLNELMYVNVMIYIDGAYLSLALVF